LTYKLNGNGSHEELGERIRSTISNLSIPSAIGANRTGSNAHARNAAEHRRHDLGRSGWGLLQFSAAAQEFGGSTILAASAVLNIPFEISGHPKTRRAALAAS